MHFVFEKWQFLLGDLGEFEYEAFLWVSLCGLRGCWEKQVEDVGPIKRKESSCRS